jgi:hypothetical protein
MGLSKQISRQAPVLPAIFRRTVYIGRYKSLFQSIARATLALCGCQARRPLLRYDCACTKPGASMHCPHSLAGILDSDGRKSIVID